MSISILTVTAIILHSQFNSDWQNAEWSKNADAHYEKLAQAAIADVNRLELNFNNVSSYWKKVQKINTLDEYYKFINVIFELQHRDKENLYHVWFMNGINSIVPMLKKDVIPRRIAYSLLWASACTSPSNISVKTAYRAWKEFRSPQALWSVATILLSAPTIKDRENAVSILEGLLRQDKSMGSLHNDLGMAYWMLGKLTKRKADFEKGIAHWEKGVQFGPKNQQKKLKQMVEEQKQELAKMKF